MLGSRFDRHPNFAMSKHSLRRQAQVMTVMEVRHLPSCNFIMKPFFTHWIYCCRCVLEISLHMGAFHMNYYKEG